MSNTPKMLDFTIANNIRKAIQIVKLKEETKKFNLVLGEILNEESRKKIESMDDLLGPVMKHGGRLASYVGDYAGEGIKWAEFHSISPSDEEGKFDIQYRSIDITNYNGIRNHSQRISASNLPDWEELQSGATIIMDEDDYFRIYEMTFLFEHVSLDEMEIIRAQGFKITAISTAWSTCNIFGQGCDDTYIIVRVEKA